MLDVDSQWENVAETFVIVWHAASLKPWTRSATCSAAPEPETRKYDS